MANIFIMDPESITALEEWSVENPGFIMVAPPFFKTFEVHANAINRQTGKGGFVFYVEFKKNGKIKISAKQNKLLFMVLTAEKKKDSKYDYDIHYRMKNNATRNEKSDVFAQTSVQLILTANAFMFYGNLEENRVIIAQGRNTDNGKIIAFRKFEDKVYAVETGKHKSPEGIFSVRGHFRRYKSGKVIWIDEYLKGLEK